MIADLLPYMIVGGDFNNLEALEDERGRALGSKGIGMREKS